jgi:hypothetical protein
MVLILYPDLFLSGADRYYDGGIAATDENRDCLTWIKGFGDGLKLLNPGNIGISNSDNHIPSP